MSTTKKKAPTPDPVFPHVAVGPSNEELLQKQAEAEQRRADSGFPKVEFGADAHDKKVDGFGDLDYDPYGVTDPLMALKQSYERPGMSLKLLSEACNDRLGHRGYQVVRDERGDPVKMGKMVLGEIPTKYADMRKRAAIAKSEEELRGIKDQSREAVERLKSDARGMGLQILDAGENIRNEGDGRDYAMGISVDRGEGSI